MYKQTNDRKRKKNVICVLDTMWKWKMASTQPFCHPLAWWSDATTARKSSVRCATCHTYTLRRPCSTQTQPLNQVTSQTPSFWNTCARNVWLTDWLAHVVSLSHRHSPSHLRTDFASLERLSPLIWIFGHSVYKNLLENDYVLLSRCGRRKTFFSRIFLLFCYRFYFSFQFFA